MNVLRFEFNKEISSFKITLFGLNFKIANLDFCKIFGNPSVYTKCPTYISQLNTKHDLRKIYYKLNIILEKWKI